MILILIVCECVGECKTTQKKTFLLNYKKFSVVFMNRKKNSPLNYKKCSVVFMLQDRNRNWVSVLVKIKRVWSPCLEDIFEISSTNNNYCRKVTYYYFLHYLQDWESSKLWRTRNLEASWPSPFYIWGHCTLLVLIDFGPV